MAVSSGLYGLSLEKFLLGTMTNSLEGAGNWVGMVNDTHTPAFDTDAFYSDIDNEIAGTGNYTQGGQALTSPAVLAASPAAGQISYDTADPQWLNSTIASAEAAFIYGEVGASAADQLILMSDFGAPASTTAGTFDIIVDATNKWFYIDYVP